jgi:glycerol-3-phosphate dehydrogenase
MSTALPRAELLARLQQPPPGGAWDLVVIGGGATGLGVALDAAVRGLTVALVESHDFASGTSSRATKLVHGGVRYLATSRWCAKRCTSAPGCWPTRRTWRSACPL